MKRTAAFLLAILSAFCVFSACTPAADLPPDTLPADDTEAPETRVTHDLPPMTFDGCDFGMLHWYVDGWTVHGIDLYAEDATGDLIGDEVYKRNSRLESALNISFSYAEAPYSEVVNTVRQSIRSDDDLYDLVYVRLADIPGIMLEGSFLDYNRDLPYINLDKPYWDQNIREELSFADHLFLAAADFNITDKNATASYLFNKDLVRDYGLPNFYDIVRAGDWTFDTLYDNMTAIDGDLDGDGKLDPENDVIGFLGAADVTVSLYYGAGGTFVEKDEYDLPESSFNTEEHFDVVSKIFDIMYDPCFLNAHKGGLLSNEKRTEYFIAKHGLFFWQRLHHVIQLRGEENVDFGILPTPKYDEMQDDYYSMISVHYTGLPSVLRTERTPETVSYVMEALAAASHYDLQSAYYEITLKTKSARDDESQDMLDIIIANRVIDIGEVYQFGSFPSTLLYFPSNVGTRDIVSAYKKAESSIEADIGDFLLKVEEMDRNRPE